MKRTKSTPSPSQKLGAQMPTIATLIERLSIQELRQTAEATPENHAEHDRDHHARDRKLQGAGQLLADLLPDRLMTPQRGPEIAMHGAFEKFHVLDQNGIVESETLSQPRDLGRRPAGGREHELGGIAGQHAHQKENNRRNAPDHGNRDQNPRSHITEHGIHPGRGAVSKSATAPVDVAEDEIICPARRRRAMDTNRANRRGSS